MDEQDEDMAVEAEQSLELEQLAAAEPDAAAEEAEAEQDKAASKPFTDYVLKFAMKTAPKGPADYRQLHSLTCMLPDPLLQQQAAGQLANSPLDPVAAHCSNRKVTFIVWHWDPVLNAFWASNQCGGNSKGTMPPCPHCYKFRTQQHQQQQVAQQAVQPGAQQPAEQGAQPCTQPVLMQWDRQRCGTVTSHKWSDPVQRYVDLDSSDHYMLGGCSRRLG